MVIQQGDLYWVDVGAPVGSAPGYERPYLVLQNDRLNFSNLNTVIVCALTSTLRLATKQGNVLLNHGEGNLPKQSVVLAGQILTIDKSEIGDYIGKLSMIRVRQVLEELRELTEPTFVEESLQPQ